VGTGTSGNDTYWGSRLALGACLGMKNIGRPCALIAHARFDEGGQVNWIMVKLLRHRQTKGAETARLNLMSYAPVLYSTLFLCLGA